MNLVHMNWPQVNTVTFKMSKLDWKNRVLKIDNDATVHNWFMQPCIDNGTTWSNMCHAFARLIDLSTWILTLAMLIVSKHSSFVNWSCTDCLLDGIYKLAPFKDIRPCSPNPLTARYLSPGSTRLQKSLFSTFSLSLMRPGYRWLTKVTQQLGVVQIKP